MTDEQPFKLGTWELVGHTLQPTREQCVVFATEYSAALHSDPLMTFSLPARSSSSTSSSVPLTIHRSRMVAAGGPIAKLVTTPFSESATHRVSFDETWEAFLVIRRFLYCLPIDMRKVPVDFALVADRWQLTVLLHACFHWADKNLFLTKGALNRSNFIEYFTTYFPIITNTNIAKQFKAHFALRFAQGFSALEDEAIAGILFPRRKEVAKSESTSKRRRLGTDRDSTDNGELRVPIKDEVQSPSLAEGARQDARAGPSTLSNAMESHELHTTDIVDVDLEHLRGWNTTHEEVWESFRTAEMLEYVVRYLTKFRSSFCQTELIDVVLSLSEPQLSDKEMSALLENFDWGEEFCLKALTSSMAKKWPLRSWRLLALHLTELRKRSSGVRLNALFRFPKGCSYLFRQQDDALVVHERRKGYDLVLILEHNRTNPGDPMLLLNVWCERRITESLAVEIWFIADNCSCDWKAGHSHVPEFTHETQGINRNYEVIAHTYRLMSKEVMQNWKRTHTPDCDMAVHVSVRLEKEQGDDG